MTLTINADETLADLLRKRAAARQLSVEELTMRLLGEAVEQLEETERWGEQNQRRVALSRKSCTKQLTADEEKELAALQSALDRRLEPMDERLLAELERLKEAVDHLPNAAQP